MSYLVQTDGSRGICVIDDSAVAAKLVLAYITDGHGLIVRQDPDGRSVFLAPDRSDVQSLRDFAARWWFDQTGGVF